MWDLNSVKRWLTGFWRFGRDAGWATLMIVVPWITGAVGLVLGELRPEGGATPSVRGVLWLVACSGVAVVGAWAAAFHVHCRRMGAQSQ